MKKRIIQFYVLTFLISWLLWSPFYFVEDLAEFWVLPGAWGPTIAAIVLTGLHSGSKGIKALLRKLTIWKVLFKYYAFAIAGILGTGLLSLLCYRVVQGASPEMNVVLEGIGLSEGQWPLAFALMPLFYIVNTLIGGPIAEELGWRGYAQGLLQERLHPNLAGLIVGFLWSIWHLPLFFLLPKAVGNMPLLPYVLSMTAMGVIFSWLYNQTRGSVLLAILLHGGMNFAEGFLGAKLLEDPVLKTIHIVLILLLALFLALKNKTAYKDTVATLGS